MSLFDGKPIGRIDFGPRPRPQEPADETFSFSPVYCDKVWKLTRQIAEGTNVAQREVTE